LSIVDFSDLVVAVMQIEYGDDQQANEQKPQDQREGAPPD
jgi:hypothetical protein